MQSETSDDQATRRRRGRVLKAARPRQWRRISRGAARRMVWAVWLLTAIVVVEMVALIAATGPSATAANGSRLGPLQAPADEPDELYLFAPGSEPLPSLVNRIGSLPASVLGRIPDVLDHYERIPWGLPVSLKRGWVSSEFSLQRVHPVTGKKRPHYGIDLAVDTGTPVTASARGVITFAGWKDGYGNVVYVDHENGMQTRYAHLSKLLVEVGDHIVRGEKIALSGETGMVTGAHLHYEVRIDGTAVNPRQYLPENLPTTRPPGM
jgi:murein DD-endopeptidase MepM/ murein hydrolase activator NlpD